MLINCCTTESLFRRTIQKAWKWSKAQCEVVRTLNTTVSPETVRKWQKMVDAYKQDKSEKNPFDEPETSKPYPTHVSAASYVPTAVSFTSLRLEFMQEESDAQKEGSIQLHATSPSTFLRQALDIEEKQYVSN